jgi:WD repeat-containing protein 35
VEAALGGTLAATLGATLGTAGATMGAGGAKRISKAFSNAWRGAAAYHYYLLALRQFYAGSLDAAMKTSIKLCEYDDILNPRNVFSLLCLTSLKNKFYGICSKAFVKLETLQNVSEADKDAIQTLAVSIFIVNAPTDPAKLPDPYVKCLEVGRSYKACVISGRAIQDSPYHACNVCRHLMLENELIKHTQGTLSRGVVDKKLEHCPLCHSPLVLSTAVSGGASALTIM